MIKQITKTMIKSIVFIIFYDIWTSPEPEGGEIVELSDRQGFYRKSVWKEKLKPFHFERVSHSILKGGAAQVLGKKDV